MSRYSQYGYYDPVGSNQPQPTGYTYQSTSNAPSYPSAATASGQGGNQQGYGSSGYSAQGYGNNATSASTSHAAAALSSLGNTDYNQTSNRGSTGQYDNSQWYGSSGNYNTSNLQPPNRSQANNSPLYAAGNHSSSTFGRLSVAGQSQSQSNANTNSYGSSSTNHNAPSNAGTNYRYQASQTAAQNPPQRYNSPLHAVQAQQHSHQKQSSRGSNQHQPSPQLANTARYAQPSRQQSASVEPSPTTVDPSQVYDNRAELERKARVDAERRKRVEAEQAAKKAEDDRLEAERQEVEEANRKATEAAEAAKKKEQQDRKNEQRRKAREEKRQSKSAATTLQQMASMGGPSTGADADEEAEMRAMFQKMREFNSKNPAMLAKLWEEERRQHSESQSPGPEKPSPAAAATTAGRMTHPRQSAAQAKSRASQTTKVPNQKQPAVQPNRPTSTPSHVSPQAMSSRPASTPGGNSTSLWPPHKKGALADATAKWLTGLPENAGRTISQQAVLNILNSNPSYVQLCESLEGLDMKFERSTLARELLKAVPDGLRTAPKPSTPASEMPVIVTKDAGQASRQTPQASVARSRGPGTVSYESPLSLSDAAREVNQMHKNQQGGAVQPPQHPYGAESQPLTNGSRPPSHSRTASQSQPPEVKPEVKPEEPPRPPANKEEAARKRNFGDLVDLTNENSDDEGPPLKKPSFQLPGQGPTTNSNGSTAVFRDPLAPLQQAQQKQQQPFQAFRYQPPPGNQIPGTGIMQPSQRPQQILPSNGQQQPQPTPPTPKGPSAEQLQQSRMRGRMLVEPIMRDRVARKSRYDSSTIARDVLLATGRHPDMRSLNAHLNQMQKLLGHHGGEVDTSGGHKCDLSTIKWDIIDPEQPKSTKSSEKPADGVNGEAPVESVESAAPQAPMTIIATVNYEAPYMSGTNQPLKEKKKRGRPRASVPGELTHQFLGNGGSPNTSHAARSSPLQHQRDTPDAANLARANDMAATGTPVGYSAFRQIGSDGQVVKKMGRPVGWRKNLHSREAQGLPPQYPKKESGNAKIGRPPREKASAALTEPSWQSFHCEWRACKAELQNLDTLKKHVVKVHGREMGGGRGYQCLWEGCGRQPEVEGGFGEIEAWMAHVDTEHLKPVAWRLGDGPRGGSLGDSPFSRRNSSSPAYLNDRYGRSITPIIEPTPPPQASEASADPNRTATTTLPIHAQSINAEMPNRPGRPPKDVADAELRKLEEHKRIVGWAVERQGCVLADDERRKTFLPDEDFEDVVDGDEE